MPKMTEITAASDFDGTEEIPVVQNGSTVKATSIDMFEGKDAFTAVLDQYSPGYTITQNAIIDGYNLYLSDRFPVSANFNATTGEYTCVRDGTYMFNYTADFWVPDPGRIGDFSMWRDRSGALTRFSIFNVYHNQFNSWNGMIYLSGMIDLVVGDKVHVRTTAMSGNVTTNHSRMQFTGVEL